MQFTQISCVSTFILIKLFELAVSNDAEADISNVERIVFLGVHHMVRMHVGSRGEGDAVKHFGHDLHGPCIESVFSTNNFVYYLAPHLRYIPLDLTFPEANAK